MKCTIRDICFTCVDNQEQGCKRGKVEYPTGCGMHMREIGSDDFKGESDEKENTD